MELYQAPGIINATTPERARSLADLIPPALIQQALTLTDTVTLRKRKLPLGSMIWLVVGMSIFCDRPMTEIVNLMDITDRTGPLLPPGVLSFSAVKLWERTLCGSFLISPGSTGINRQCIHNGTD